MKRIAIACLSLFAVACSNETPAEPAPAAPAPVEEVTADPALPGYTRIEFAAPQATPDERTACEAAGGVIELSGKLQWENCVQTFADAGKACSGNADCVGECRYEGAVELPPGAAVTGTCQVTDARFGCNTVVENGKIAHTLCVD
ncbi:MAG: hypothetical protein Q8S09_14110 [Hyphomonas sp.]|nr:hypothetical protein [Hyphomonas sp.]